MKIAATAVLRRPVGAPLLLQGKWASAFHIAAQCGCDGVELHLRQAAEANARTIRRLMADNGLRVSTIGTGLAAALDGLTFSDPDSQTRSLAVARVNGHSELAGEIGAAVIIGLVRGRLGRCSDEVRRERRLRALECLSAVCTRAASLGVTMLLEPLNRYECDYINTLADATAIVHELGAGNLRLLADTFHMSIEESCLASSLIEAGSLLGHVHLADTNRQALGRGHLDVGGILNTLTALKYTGWLSFEFLPPPDPIRGLRDAVTVIHASRGGERK